MRRLMLLRHAKTESDAPSGEDIDRCLDERGRGDAAAVGAWMAARRLSAERVLVSTAARARQTWDIVAPLLGRAPAEAIALPALYLAEPADILRAVHGTAADIGSLLVIGHNPGLHELALMLSGDGAGDARAQLAGNLPTCGLAVIDFAITDWRDAAFQRGRLEHFVSPKRLKLTSSGD